jgi:hypothetical protein
MPPYENQSLHEMHALLQQFDTLNAAHGPEYCEGRLQDAGKAVIAGAKAAKAAAAAAAASAAAAANGAIDAHNQHKQEVKTQKDTDTAVLKAWGGMNEATKRSTLKKAVDAIDPNVLGPMLLGNAATKQQTQECILPSSA